MLKGALFGLVLSFVFAFAYYTRLIGGIRSNAAVSVSLVTHMILYRPLFWIALLLIFAACCVCGKLLRL